MHIRRARLTPGPWADVQLVVGTVGVWVAEVVAGGRAGTASVKLASVVSGVAIAQPFVACWGAVVPIVGRIGFVFFKHKAHLGLSKGRRGKVFFIHRHLTSRHDCHPRLSHIPKCTGLRIR